MDCNQHFIDLLRLLEDPSEWPVPHSSPLSMIVDLGERAVPLLIEALRHDDPVVRRTAVDALGQLRSSFGHGLDLQAAVPHLEAMLGSDTDTLARLNAAEAIWQITGDKKVVPDFIEALRHEDVEVRCFAISMIGLVEADPGETLRPLIEALADPNPFVRGTAATVLADHGSAAAEALPRLERFLENDEFTRVTAIHAILCIDSSRTEE
jgi:HEAT repeat protein